MFVGIDYGIIDIQQAIFKISLLSLLFMSDEIYYRDADYKPRDPDKGEKQLPMES